MYRTNADRDYSDFEMETIRQSTRYLFILLGQSEYNTFDMMRRFLNCDIRRRQDLHIHTAAFKTPKQIIGRIVREQACSTKPDEVPFDDIILEWMALIYTECLNYPEFVSSKICEMVPPEVLYAHYNPNSPSNYNEDGIGYSKSNTLKISL